eukprot:Skav201468  [mRNA]  locus=scaffold663:60524:60817:- [translate_table: standard]
MGKIELSRASPTFNALPSCHGETSTLPQLCEFLHAWGRSKCSVTGHAMCRARVDRGLRLCRQPLAASNRSTSRSCRHLRHLGLRRFLRNLPSLQKLL